jgi:hypothetical protein
MRLIKRFVGRFLLFGFLALSLLQTGCLPGMRGGPPRLPGLPGLPGPPHGAVSRPVRLASAEHFSVRLTVNQTNLKEE